ncbi:MAG: hypothetical protein CBC42_00010 [Betaproteobacteria bacterium TMED82]|nr:MAG: hypothetical protein CBC42_00010 [Betaproteobacteria bacterium TMED82]|tara:strand:+ start:659 stop:1006 length:348 start_codon:yes stop_codon:yes gene_type:complete
MSEKKTSLTTGQIATCWNDFERIITTQLKRDPKDFFRIPVSVVVKRRSNNQAVDQLQIENIAMDRNGTDVWLECFVDDKEMIKKEPKVKSHLDESEKTFENLSKQLGNKIEKSQS